MSKLMVLAKDHPLEVFRRRILALEREGYSDNFLRSFRRSHESLFDLLTLARQYASECGECAGVRRVPSLKPDGTFGPDEPCTECADIWTVIDRAEGRT